MENNGGRGLELQREGREFTEDGKTKCLVHRCLPDYAKTVGHTQDFDLQPC